MSIGRFRFISQVYSPTLVLLLVFAMLASFASYSRDSIASHGEILNLTNDDEDSRNPSVAISFDDILYLAWRGGDSLGDVMVGSTSDGDNLESIVNVSNSTEIRSANPDIAVSSARVVYVVWEEGDLREIFIANSTDNFATPINVSNDQVSSFPRVEALSNGDVYVTWAASDIGEIFIANSTDNFATPTNISNSAETSSHPDIAVSSAGVVYVVWQEEDIGEIFIANSTDNFATPTNISNSADFSSSPRIEISSTDELLAAWTEELASNIVDIFVANSTDNFATPTNISSNDNAASSTPDIAISNENDILVAWDESDFTTGSTELLLSASFSGGGLGTPTNIATISSGSPQPRIAVSSIGDIFAFWVDDGPTSRDIFSKGNIEFAEASITVTAINNSSPKWDIDEVVINGTTNAFSIDDVVSIDWGDGAGPTEVSLAPDGSWSATYTYDSAAISTNPNNIIASLLAADTSAKATSDPWQVEVARHSTDARINHIPSIALGYNVTVSGSLVDTDTGDVGIGSGMISFTGTGSEGLNTTITAGNGEFSSTGSSPTLVGQLLTVQPNFAGNDLYESSEGNVKSYIVADGSTTEFDLASGNGAFLNLTGFGASVEFGQPLDSGIVYVSSCDPPASARYIDVGLCLLVALGAEFSPENEAHISVQFSGATIPLGNTEDDVSVFYEGISGMVDLTESRDVSTHTVIARTEEFGKFMVAIALHEDQASGDVRQELFVGENEISSVPPHVTLDKEEYSISDSPLITIADINANIDITERETVSALVSSTTGTDGIMVDFQETDEDSGIFTGTFSFTSASSSADLLQASDGDDITISYTSFPTRFNATIDVIEAGVADISTVQLASSEPIRPYVGGIELELIDAVSSSSNNITVTMSYEDVDLNGALPETMRLFQKQGVVWKNITVPGGNDDQNRQIVGVTDVPGIFAIGCDSQQQGCGGPGGGGGGLPRPGTGVLLDNAARVIGDEPEPESSERSSGGGGGGSSRSTSITATPSGSDVETSVVTERGTVTVAFETVQEGSGQLKVDSSELATFEEFFEEISFLSQDNDEHGMVQIDGRTYATAGDVFDIDASSVIHEGAVTVTIPFDSAAVESFSSSEADVRFLHYNDLSGTWEDMTVSVDETANTVTGVLDSLSAVAAAIVIDGPVITDDSMARIMLANTTFTVSESGEVTLSTQLSNTLLVNQDYVLLVQVVDEGNVAQHIAWQAGSLGGNQSSEISISWAITEEGRYTIQVLVLSDLVNPLFLSEPSSLSALI